VTWTKGLDPGTGRPVDYDPAKDLQTYAALPGVMDSRVSRPVCPDQSGGNNFWLASFSPRTALIDIPSVGGCTDMASDHSAHVMGKFAGGTFVNRERLTSNLVAVDPATGKRKISKALPYPSSAGALSTAGG
jgi:alcohol dehydrogenase (cytochrome c)